jgi:rare lipoprotein A
VLLTTVLGLNGAKASDEVVPAKNPSINPGAAPNGDQQPAKPKKNHRWFQFGRASWYGGKFQGRSTASGETYDMNGMTCAHRSLPLGTVLKVTNLRNHKTVVVRVNDRGPVPEDRIVDLSYAAAQTLGFLGVAKVRIDLMTKREIAQLSWPRQADLVPQQ